MTPRMLSVLMVLSGGLLFLVFWGASIGFVYWDVYRRDLPWRQQILWIAVVALLPLLGFFIYLFARLVLPAFRPGSQDRPRFSPRVKSQLRKRDTMAMHVPGSQVYLPTIAVETAGEPAVQRVKSVPHPGTYPARNKPAYTFSLVSGPGAGREFSIESLPVSIGRATGATIRLEADRSVSRQHAEIYEQAGGLFIRDLDSRHGTQVNGVWISDQRLEAGDEILVGDSLLVFEAMEYERR